jgi:hypothetical protein
VYVKKRRKKCLRLRMEGNGVRSGHTSPEIMFSFLSGVGEGTESIKTVEVESFSGIRPREPDLKY